MPAAVRVGEFMMVGERPGSAADPAGGSIAFASPKSSTFTLPSSADLDVRGLEVAMHDAFLVRRLERLGDLARDGERLVGRERAMREPLRERRPFDQLHHQRACAGRLFEPEDRGDVRMMELREKLRLALETGQTLLVLGECRRAGP